MFRAANIGSSFKTVRDRHMVTMKHYWEVDIGLSESAKKLTSDDLDEVISSRESQSGPYRLNGCSWVHDAYEKNVHHCQLSKNAP